MSTTTTEITGAKIVQNFLDSYLFLVANYNIFVKSPVSVYVHTKSTASVNSFNYELHITLALCCPNKEKTRF